MSRRPRKVGKGEWENSRDGNEIGEARRAWTHTMVTVRKVERKVWRGNQWGSKMVGEGKGKALPGRCIAAPK